MGLHNVFQRVFIRRMTTSRLTTSSCCTIPTALRSLQRKRSRLDSKLSSFYSMRPYQNNRRTSKPTIVWTSVCCSRASSCFHAGINAPVDLHKCCNCSCIFLQLCNCTTLHFRSHFTSSKEVVPVANSCSQLLNRARWRRTSLFL